MSVRLIFFLFIYLFIYGLLDGYFSFSLNCCDSIFSCSFLHIHSHIFVVLFLPFAAHNVVWCVFDSLYVRQHNQITAPTMGLQPANMNFLINFLLFAQIQIHTHALIYAQTLDHMVYESKSLGIVTICAYGYNQTSYFIFNNYAMLNFLLRFVAAGLFGRVRFFSLYLAALFIIFRFSLLHCISIVMFRFLFERFTHTH